MHAEQDVKHLGQTAGCQNHNHDMIHELSRRLDALWRYDQYIANADFRDGVRQFWEDAKQQEEQNVQRLKCLLVEELQSESC